MKRMLILLLCVPIYDALRLNKPTPTREAYGDGDGHGREQAKVEEIWQNRYEVYRGRGSKHHHVAGFLPR